MSKSGTKLVIAYERDRKCSICFEDIDRRCLTDWCRHQFCLKCLMRWAEAHNYCPECRQLFNAILYVNDLRYDNDFEVLVIENSETKSRRELTFRYMTLRNRLIKEIDKRKDGINDLKKRVLDIQDVCHRIDIHIRELDSKQHQNNGVLKETIDRIAQELNRYELEMDTKTSQTNRTADRPQQQIGNNDNNFRTFWIKSVFEGLVAYILGFFRFRIRIF